DVSQLARSHFCLVRFMFLNPFLRYGNVRIIIIVIVITPLNISRVSFVVLLGFLRLVVVVIVVVVVAVALASLAPATAIVVVVISPRSARIVLAHCVVTCIEVRIIVVITSASNFTIAIVVVVCVDV